MAESNCYIGAVGANIQTVNLTRCLPGMYDIPLIDIAARCVFTNTTPTAPYRGAGRPEANYMLERVVEEAARVSGIDAIKLRRERLDRLRAWMSKADYGAVLLFDPYNQRYATGSRNMFGYFLRNSTRYFFVPAAGAVVFGRFCRASASPRFWPHPGRRR
jgi:hypothetical protein